MDLKIKDIKRTVRKKLKKKFPNFKRLTKKGKKAIAKQVLEQAYKNYDFSNDVQTDKYELLNVEPIPENIYNLHQIEELHDNFNVGTLPFKIKHNLKAIKDPELKTIHEMVN